MIKQFKILVLLLVFISCNNGEKVMVYLIPKGYEGPLVLIEDPQAQDSVNIEGDKIIFDFRESEILRFRGQFIQGSFSLSNLKYYYVDDEGNKTKIPIALGNDSSMDSNTVYLYLRHTQIRSNSKCEVLSTTENFDKNISKQYRLCDSLFSTYPR